MFVYRTHGTCATQIDLDIQDGVITACQFHKGCEGNHQGLCRLVIGQNALEVADKLAGIACQGNTSCPDQLSQAIRACLKKD